MRFRARPLREGDSPVCGADDLYPAILFVEKIDVGQVGKRKSIPICKKCIQLRGLYLCGDGDNMVLSDEQADIDRELERQKTICYVSTADGHRCHLPKGHSGEHDCGCR